MQKIQLKAFSNPRQKYGLTARKGKDIELSEKDIMYRSSLCSLVSDNFEEIIYGSYGFLSYTFSEI